MRLLSWLLFAGYVSTVAAQEVAFRFNPHDGITLTETTRRIIQESQKGTPELRKTTEDSTDETTIRRTSEGYIFERVCRKMAAVVNGVAWTNPITPAIVGVTIALTVSRDGQILAIAGLEQTQRIARDTLPAPFYDAIKDDLTPANLEDVERSTWQHTYGLLIGKTMRTNEWFTKTINGPTGSDPLFAIYFLQGVTNLARNLRVARIAFYASTDSSEITAEQFPDLNRAADFIMLPHKKRPLTRVVGFKLVDPDTLIAIREEETQATYLSRPVKVEQKVRVTQRKGRNE
jgi:hypothetical protein